MRLAQGSDAIARRRDKGRDNSDDWPGGSRQDGRHKAECGIARSAIPSGSVDYNVRHRHFRRCETYFGQQSCFTKFTQQLRKRQDGLVLTMLYY